MFGGLVRALFVGCALLLVSGMLSACGGTPATQQVAAPEPTAAERQSGTERKAAPKKKRKPEQAAKPVRSSRCKKVPSTIVRGLSEALIVTGGGSVRNVWAVKSKDYKKAWFVSGDLQGSGLEGDRDIATWVTNSVDPKSPGSIFTVDAVAKEFSDWADGKATDAGFDMGDDGAQESQSCLK